MMVKILWLVEFIKVLRVIVLLTITLIEPTNSMRLVKLSMSMCENSLTG